MKQVSVIVPTLNEEANIFELVERFNAVFKSSGVDWEIIFIDDNSKDKTPEKIRELSKRYPVFLYSKKGKPGKAHSLLEGFEYAKFPFIAMIDADLQYPPDAVVPMLKKINENCDIVVANRANHKTDFTRKLLSRGFSFLFSRFLHNLDCDVQSGLKVFRRRIIKEVEMDPTPWTFDLEFLLKARNYGYSIGTYDIIFSERKSGHSKIIFWKAVWEIGTGAVRMKFKRNQPLSLNPENNKSMAGAGMAHKRKRFITHTTLHHRFSAINTFSLWQKLLIAGLILSLFFGFLIQPMDAAIILVGILSAIYFIDVLFNIFLAVKSLGNPSELKSASCELKNLDQVNLPVYSILCPLYREANVLPAFVKAMSRMDWPENKLDVMLLLEENDQETIEAANSMRLPEFVRVVIVPHSMPKTKPKACNYGLSFAKGEYVVIYDAEDVPDPLQLKKAYLGFQKSPLSVRCLQAKLNYYNPHQNFLTRLFTAEYSLWFDLTLPGLQSINTAIPLGGTSNHFRTRDLLELEGWDPFNVTEDCDLGVRIFARGYRTAIIDSVTLEEANSKIGNWLRQRSRWIKGYMQTYLVHMRNPWKFFRENGAHALLFQLVVGGKLAFILINPILWLATIAYFSLNAYVGPTIEALYPSVVFYMAVTSLIFGNFLAMYYYMLGCAKRGHWSVIKYVFLIPFYWLLVSAAGLIALYQLFVKPHYWEKTHHGLHLNKNKKPFLFLRWLPSFLDEKISSKKVKANNKENAFLEEIKNHMWFKFFVSPEGLFFQMLLFSNFINFIFSVYIGKALTFKDLGLLTVINTIWYITTIFVYPFGTTVNRHSAHLSASKNQSISLGFLYALFKKSALLIFSILILWILFSPLTSRFLNVSDQRVFLFFTPAIFFGVIMSSYCGFLQGNLFFISTGVIYLIEALSKLAIAFIFIWIGVSDLVYLSIPASIVLAAIFAVSILAGKKIKAKKINNFSFPIRFFSVSFLSNISIAIFLSLDIILVKHFFSPELAGQYALVSLVGKIIFFLGSMPNMFMMTFVSRAIGLGKNPERILKLVYRSTAAIVTIGFIGLGFLGRITVPLIFGNKAEIITPYLPAYAFAMALFTLTNVLVTYHLSRKNYFFNILSFFISASMILGIIFFHHSIGDIIKVILATSILGWVSVSIIHYFGKRAPFLRRGLLDLWGIFINGLPKTKPSVSTGKRILIFNWRDKLHSYAGGAEVYVYQIAKIWVTQGNHVTIFCGSDGKQTRYETIDGIDIVRRGGFYLVYVWAFFYYIFRFRGRYDIVIDCENGVPFFTPLYVRKPIFCLLHHIHQEVFFHSLPRPLAMLASFLEKDLMPLIYRNIKFITVSQSSKEEMEKLGIGKAGISVVHNGVHLRECVIGEKSAHPMILYLGRLKAYKSVDVLIRAFSQVLEKNADAVLIIAGSGDAEKYLKNLAKELGFSDQQVIFKGWVTDEERIKLLQNAWVLVNPSFMEGWGIVVIEANACGTPVIASDVPGLRDSVKVNQSGFLVPYGNTDAFAGKILHIIEDKQQREKMNMSARQWAENFDWGKSSQNFLSFILEYEKKESNE